MARKNKRIKSSLSSNPKLSHNNPNPSFLTPETSYASDDATVKSNFKDQLKVSVISLKHSKLDIPYFVVGIHPELVNTVRWCLTKYDL